MKSSYHYIVIFCWGFSGPCTHQAAQIGLDKLRKRCGRQHEVDSRFSRREAGPAGFESSSVEEDNRVYGAEGGEAIGVVVLINGMSQKFRMRAAVCLCVCVCEHVDKFLRARFLLCTRVGISTEARHKHGVQEVFFGNTEEKAKPTLSLILSWVLEAFQNKTVTPLGCLEKEEERNFI